MKIISKYKDFYDFIVQDHDADLTYVRNIGFINEYYDDLFKREGNYVSYYSKNYGYYNNDNNREHGEFKIDNMIFGIYPFVYSQPIIRIYYKYNESYLASEFIILGNELTNNLLDSSTIVSKTAYEEGLIPLVQSVLDEKYNKGICSYVKAHLSSPNTFDSFKKLLKKYTWKVDCPEIFYKINAPVFVKYYKELFETSTYPTDLFPHDIVHYITNISFQKLDHNILKYWYNELFDLNTYINIENFLWSVKQEPISNPDNKTRILAHGFDLKTSFRKM